MYQLDHVGVTVSDLQIATDFYTAVFQTAIIESGNRVTRVGLPQMRSVVELRSADSLPRSHERVREGAAAPTDIGAIHLGLYVDSAEAQLARLGRPTTGSVTNIPYGPCKGGKTAYLRDPDGVNIQFMQLTQRPGKLPIPPGPDAWIDHVGIVVRDLDASLAFYAQLLDAQPVDRAAWRGKDADYVAAMLGRASGLELEAGFVRIPDTNTLLELIEYSGFDQPRVDAAPTDIGAVHLGFSTGSASGGQRKTIRDPDGIIIELQR